MMLRAGRRPLHPRPALTTTPFVGAKRIMATAYPIVPGVTFKEVVGYSDYCVGDDGSVWSRRRKSWQLMRPFGNGNGYQQAKLCNGQMTKKVYIHKIVLTAFVGPRPHNMQACHCDGDKSNNVLSNLRWDTSFANQADRVRHGTSHEGAKNHRAKLTEDQVRSIRQLKTEGLIDRVISARFGISREAVTVIVNRKRWKHV